MVAHVSRTARWLRRGVALLVVLALLAGGVGWGLAQDKKDDVKKDDVKKDEPKKEEPKKDEPKKEDPNKDEPKKDEPKKEEPKKLDPAEVQKRMEETRKKFQKIEQEAREQIQKARQEMEKEMAELQRQLQTVPPRVVPPGFPPGVRPFFPQPRLGVSVDEPSAAMVEQLGLDRGKGLVVTDVLPDSAAAKAGLKKYDVLVEFNGKPIPSNREGFTALIAEPKANTPVDVEVIRKGKKETVKGVTLPEATAPRPAPLPFAPPRRGSRPVIAAPAARLCGC
jgi:hypothetical protein